MTISTADATALAKSDWRDLSPAAKYRLRWKLQARPNQLTPQGDWNVWLILAGRGFGKTRTGAEDVALFANENPSARIAVVAPTYADARDTCVEGESGLLSVLHPSLVANWNRSMGELSLINGSRFKLFSADSPERLRGPQHHRVWCDELAAWEYPETWDQIMFGLRLGEHPQVVATTTPKPTKLIRSLVKREDVYVTRGSTFENAANLSVSALAQLKERYEGTRLGRQELFAEILEDVEGALWSAALIESERRSVAPDLVACVVAVDPAVSSNPDSDETGIVVTGRGVDGRGYVLADRSCRLSPDGAMRRAIAAYNEFSADHIVVEKNNGGDYLPALVHAIDAGIPVQTVSATRGKMLRAEPVSALYEQAKVSHVGTFAELEDQMTSWTPESGISPDRLDSLVWGLTDVMPLQGVPVFLGAF